MGFFDRLSRLVRANANAAVSSMEDGKISINPSLTCRRIWSSCVRRLPWRSRVRNDDQPGGAASSIQDLV